MAKAFLKGGKEELIKVLVYFGDDGVCLCQGDYGWTAFKKMSKGKEYDPSIQTDVFVRKPLEA